MKKRTTPTQSLLLTTQTLRKLDDDRLQAVIGGLRLASEYSCDAGCEMPRR